MTHSDCLAPSGMDREEKDIVAESGGWTDHLATYDLKPWNEDDNAEGQAIVEAQGDQARAEAAEDALAAGDLSTEDSEVVNGGDENYDDDAYDAEALEDVEDVEDFADDEDTEDVAYEQDEEEDYAADDYAEDDYNDGNDDYDDY